MNKKWSLNLIFTLPFLLQMFVTVSLIGFFSYQTGKQSSLEFADQLREKIDSEIKQKLDQYLSIPHLLNQLNIAAIERGDLSLDLTQNNPRNEVYLWQMIKQFPGVSWISLGMESGGENLSIVRDPSQEIIKIVFSNIHTDYYTTVYTLDAQGKRVTSSYERAPYQYDARKRPWYSNAAVAGHPVWSPLYQTPSKARQDSIFISNSYPIFNKNHQLLGVTSIDYDLVNIEEFIKKLSLGNHHTGKTFIIERSGLLVASSTGERPFLKKNGKRTNERLHVVNSQDPLIQASGRFLEAHFTDLAHITQPQDLEFKALNQQQLLQMIPYQDQAGLNWLIVTVVPQQDFLTPINENAYKTLQICLIALACSTLISSLITRWLTQPILLLNQAAQNIVLGCWDSALPLHRQDELGELAQSFQLMSQQLKESVEDLEIRVKKRTLDLEESKGKVEEKNTLLKLEHDKLQQEIEYRQIIEEQLRQSQDFLSSILNYSHDGIIAIETAPQGFRCRVVNPLMAKMLRCSADRFVNKIIPKRFFDRLDPALFHQLLEVIQTGYPLKKDICYQRNAQQYWYNLIAIHLDNGLALTIRDITAQKQLELKLYNLAHQDGLTGIYNRRWFDETLRSEWQTCLAKQQSLALILCDVDYFKYYNDRYGHQAGDECLQRVAQTLAHVAHAQQRFSASRYGGEEFVVLLPGLDWTEAVMVAQRIQRLIHNLQIPHGASSSHGIVSLSLGIVSVVPQPQMSEAYLLHLADQSLYRAKNQGRNCYVVFNAVPDNLVC